MNYYNEIKEQLIKSEIYDRVKDYSKDRHKVSVYFEIGRLLSEAGKEYGKNIIKQYSEKLMVEVGKKYNYRTLYRMRKFYIMFSNEKLTPMESKWNTMCSKFDADDAKLYTMGTKLTTMLSKWSTTWTKLTWSHYCEVLSLKDIDEIIYYLNECESKNLTQRQLHELIKNNTYKRLPIETKNKLAIKEKIEVNDLVPNPVQIKNNTGKDIFTEKVLQLLILEDIPSFLKELGTGFTFIDYEYPIKLGNTYNYIDLLLYNIKYKCYVVVELKITDLKKEHTGQIMTYMNYIDANIKTIEENNTVGIIICKHNNEYVIKYCSDNRIISREYRIV